MHDYHIICEGESISWQGDYYSATIETFKTFTSSTGADSIHVLNLLVNPGSGTFAITGRTEVCAGETIFYMVSQNPAVEYRWSVDKGDIISGAEGDTLELLWIDDGEGEVIAWAENIHGCTSDTTRLQVKIHICDGIPALSSAAITLYPVPLHDILQIESTVPFARVEIIDLRGVGVLTSFSASFS